MIKPNINSLIHTAGENKKVTIILGLVILTAVVLFLLIYNKPQASKRPIANKAIAVEVVTATKQSYPITILASGSVAAATRSNLVAQVRGEITYVSEKFNNGGQFKKGDTLLRINNKEYIASTNNAEAAYLQAQSNYSQEKINAEQAEKDWQRLGFAGQPNDLVLRKPQLQAATAQLKATKATVESASLDLQRTRISAPYDGYTISKQVDLGQYVTIGSVLGDIYADKGIEVNLPLTQNSYAQLDLQSQPKVTLYATFAGITHNWLAKITRADNTFNPTTRQINVVATVDNIISDQGLELKIGQFVNARITGRIAENIFVIPNNSIREGKYVFLFANQQLNKQNINIVWQDQNNSIVSNISSDDQVVLTNLGGVADGTKARVINNKNKTLDDTTP